MSPAFVSGSIRKSSLPRLLITQTYAGAGGDPRRLVVEAERLDLRARERDARHRAVAGVGGPGGAEPDRDGDRLGADDDVADDATRGRCGARSGGCDRCRPSRRARRRARPADAGAAALPRAFRIVVSVCASSTSNESARTWRGFPPVTNFRSSADAMPPAMNTSSTSSSNRPRVSRVGCRGTPLPDAVFDALRQRAAAPSSSRRASRRAPASPRRRRAARARRARRRARRRRSPAA